MNLSKRIEEVLEKHFVIGDMKPCAQIITKLIEEERAGWGVRCFFGFHHVQFNCREETPDRARCIGMCTLCGTVFDEYTRAHFTPPLTK